MPLSGAVSVMSNPKVKQKVTAILSQPKKKMKKLLANRQTRKSYAKIAIQHDQIYDDEDLEMDVDLGYGLNEAYEYKECEEPQHNLFMDSNTVNSTSNTVNTRFGGGDSEYPTSIHLHSSSAAPSSGGYSSYRTSVTQTFLDDVMSKGIYRKTESCLIPLYLLVLMLSLITTGLLVADQVSTAEGMGILSAFTLCGSMAGCYFVYQWGIYDDVLLFLNLQNTKYQDNVERLTSMGEVLQNDVDDIHTKIEVLNRDGIALNESVRAYNELKQELQRVLKENGDGNGELMEMMEEVARLQSELESVMEDNEKARLLSIFYSVKLYDYGRGNCLDRKQYARFLQYCNKETRAKFEKYGGFDAMDPNQCGMVQQNYFEQMVHKVLADTIEDSQHLLDSTIKIRGNL